MCYVPSIWATLQMVACGVDELYWPDYLRE
jgi:hypothetical protein